MGYWWPPSLWSFDPTERPFVWNIVTYKEAAQVMGYAAPVAFESVKVALPNEYDREFLSLINSGWVVTPETVKKQGLLGTYASLLAVKAPGDPDTGGLGPDYIEPDGTIAINYYDFSDQAGAKRKRARYVPSKGGGYELANRNDNEGGVPQEWNPKAQEWRKEGPDAEREFWKASGPALSALVTIMATALAAVPGGQVGSSIIAMAWSVGMKAVAAGKAPDLGDIIGAVGASGVLGVLSANIDLQKAFTTGFIGEMGKLGGDWASKIGQVSTSFGKNFPKIDLEKMWPGFDSVKWAQGLLKNLPKPPIPIAFGSPNSQVTMAQSDDYVRHAWDQAARAFAEPDPKKRLQIRRNYSIADGGSSNMVTHGDQAGIAAHGEVETGPGVQTATAIFDQFLVAMIASIPGIKAPRGVSSAMSGGTTAWKQPGETDLQAAYRAKKIVAEAFCKHPNYGPNSPQCKEKTAAADKYKALVDAEQKALHNPKTQADLLDYVTTIKARYHIP